MSEKLSLSSSVMRFCAALAFGAAICAACMGACAAVMAQRGLPSSLAGTLSVLSACAGSAAGGWLHAALQRRRALVCGLTLGTAFAVILLTAEGLSGNTPDHAQVVRYAIIALAGSAGGLLRALRPPKRRKTG